MGLCNYKHLIMRIQNRYYVLLAAGIFCLLVALLQLKQSLDFIHNGVLTTGVVTSFADDGESLSPVFSVTVNDTHITYEHPVATSPPSWHIGEEASFIYDPMEPGQVKMRGYFWLFNQVIIWMTISILLSVPAIGYIVLNKLIL